jgi:FAD/FMN-containing dehydrogenase/Fe-S oxidoreductase
VSLTDPSAVDSVSDPTPARQRIREFAESVRGRIAGDLRLDTISRALYATDASIYEIMPLAVLLPRTPDDVQAALLAARAHGVPVLARGGGSSLAGQTVNEALVIDFSQHLDAVLDLDVEAGRIRVQPGITHERLGRALAGTGWMMGPDPASGSRATLGGMMANNATGTHSILYGNTIRHVERAAAVLADGTLVDWGAIDADAWRAAIRRTDGEGRVLQGLDMIARGRGEIIRTRMPRHWRRNNGYRVEELLEPSVNPARLLCGSEGTLAVVTDLTVSLVRRPVATAVGVVHFAMRREALESVTAILETDPSAVELFDGAAIAQCRASRGFAHRMTFVEGNPGAILLTEYYGEVRAELSDRLDRLEKRVVGPTPATGIVRLEDPAAIENAWTVRREALGLIMSVRGNLKPLPFIEDASVPVEHLADYISDLEEVFTETGSEAVMYAHASAGCLHVRPFIDTTRAEDVARMERIASASADLVRRYEGWVSSEHGDGLTRSWLNPVVLGEELYGVCREVKHLFDPEGILNPGRIVDAPPMTGSLRNGPDYAAIPVETRLDFGPEGGLVRAIELCNGNGACRRVGGGTMCPSFMATREESDSTRGRANVLRMAMAGRTEGVDWTDPAVYEVLDLCVQCKACKTECPSAVDMAKIKTEWLDHYWRTHSMPLRTRFFAEMPRAARLLSGPAAPFVNAVAASRPVRWLLDRALGIHRDRTLPRFARRPFIGSWKSNGGPTGGRRVVLFADTFHNHQDTEPAHAAARFLTAAGYEVIPVGDVCCGRTYLSKGVVTSAQIQALKTVDRLHPFVEEGLRVVGLEPSCILTIADEFTSLLPGDPRTRRVAEAARTFEAFIAEEAEAGHLVGLEWRPDDRQFLVHGHCHQKALDGMDPSIRCLSVPGGRRVTAIDSACCGMAGAFGYEKEHYAVSRAMAQDRLMPAVRSADIDAVIVAAGTSCRAQIRDLSGRRALHPAQVLEKALVGRVSRSAR